MLGGVRYLKQCRGLAGAVSCELRDVEMQWPALDVLSIEGVLLDRRASAPSDVENIFLTRAELLWWKKKHVIT